MRLDAYLKKAASEAFAQRLVLAMKIICGIHAPMVGGRPTRATPGAPPRRVTSRLWESIRAYGNKVEVHAPYAKYLEGGNHKFVRRAVKLAQEMGRTSTGKITRVR
jgi:acyl-coenzyme A synthetase/AMP-(fatty) acid ligase